MKRAHKLLTPYPSLRHDLACVGISRLVHDDLMKTLRPAYSDLQKSLRLFAALVVISYKHVRKSLKP